MASALIFAASALSSSETTTFSGSERLSASIFGEPTEVGSVEDELAGEEGSDCEGSLIMISVQAAWFARSHLLHEHNYCHDDQLFFLDLLSFGSSGQSGRIDSKCTKESNRIAYENTHTK